MTELTHMDLNWCLRRLPDKIRKAMKTYGERLILAGGFIRSAIANERINDVDLFVPSKEVGETIAAALIADHKRAKKIETDNAITIIGLGMPIQIITRWVYDAPEKVVASFDFTVAQSAIWWVEGDGLTANSHFTSMISDRFYPDLAAKRLVYTKPDRNEDAGGSILRVLKFYQRGYRIPLDSLGAVIVRLLRGVEDHKGWSTEYDEQWLERLITGLLQEVDPTIDLTHQAHLPSEKTETTPQGEAGDGMVS